MDGDLGGQAIVSSPGMHDDMPVRSEVSVFGSYFYASEAVDIVRLGEVPCNGGCA